LVNSRCIFRVFSYLGLISFIFTTAGIFAWGFNFFSRCTVVFAKTYFIFLLSRASNRQIHSEYFFFTFIRKVTWLIKFETRKCSEVKDLTCFPSAVVFAKTYYTFLPSRTANRQIHLEYFNRCLTKQIEYSWKRKTTGIIYLASVLNNIRCKKLLNTVRLWRKPETTFFIWID
jgi:hypothetical protein